jgi:predicted alpha/beta hydrolase
METKEIIYSDKTKSKVAIYGTGNNNITLILLPAMGVRATFYNKFANNLSSLGFNVITADWRGQGYSSVRASRTTNFGYKEYIKDIKELFDYTNIWFPDTKKIIVGHSLGGQIGSLIASRYSNLLSGLILITSCNVYYKGWKNWSANKVYIAAKIFYPISKIIGFFPGNIIGFGGKEARYVMKDWSNNGLNGTYKIANSNFDYEIALKKLRLPVLSISIENDFLASKISVENLYNKFNSESNIKHIHLAVNNKNMQPLNHFNWTKEPDYFSEIIKKWIIKNIKK